MVTLFFDDLVDLHIKTLHYTTLYTTDNQGKKASTNWTITTWNFKRTKDIILPQFREKFMTIEWKCIRERDLKNMSQLMSQGDQVSPTEMQGTGQMRSMPYSAPFWLEQVCIQRSDAVFADPGVNGVLITSQASTLKEKGKSSLYSPFNCKIR